MPAWLAPVCDERSVSHSIRLVPAVGQPPRQHGRVAVAHRAAQHRPGEPVDLEEDRCPARRCVPFPLPLGDPLDHAQRVDVVVVDAEEHLQHHARRRHHQRREQRPAERVDLEVARREVRDEQQDQRVDDQDRNESEHQRQRQAQRRHQRRQDRVQDSDQRGRLQRTEERLDLDAREDQARHERPRRRRRAAPAPDAADGSAVEPPPTAPARRTLLRKRRRPRDRDRLVRNAEGAAQQRHHRRRRSSLVRPDPAAAVRPPAAASPFVGLADVPLLFFIEYGIAVRLHYASTCCTKSRCCVDSGRPAAPLANSLIISAAR